MRDATRGEWFYVRDEVAFANLLQFGAVVPRLEPDAVNHQIGTFRGRGAYLLLTYSRLTAVSRVYESVRELLCMKEALAELECVGRRCIRKFSEGIDIAAQNAESS